MTDSPRRFDLIVFDWDGTLYDSTRVIVRCIQAAVAEVGGRVPSDREAADVIGIELGRALARVAPDVPPEKHAALGTAYRRCYGLHHADLALFDGVLPLLDTLRQRGHRLAVATGMARRALDAALATVALRGRFDASRTADETEGKPQPRMLLELMQELEVPPTRTLMIGDTTYDLEMARNAGCASVGVGYGAQGQGGFAAFKPLAVAMSVAQLQDWLLAHG